MASDHPLRGSHNRRLDAPAMAAAYAAGADGRRALTSSDAGLPCAHGGHDRCRRRLHVVLHLAHDRHNRASLAAHPVVAGFSALHRDRRDRGWIRGVGRGSVGLHSRQVQHTGELSAMFP